MGKSLVSCAPKFNRPQIMARPPNLAVLLTHCGQLVIRKICIYDATRCQVLRLKCTKFDFHWGYAPDPAGGAYSAPQTLIVFSISNISVDEAVDRYVSSGISGALRRESEFLRELTSIIETEYYVCHLFSARVILRHLSSMFVFLGFSVFIFLLR